MSEVIVAEHLSKTFKVFDRRPGIMGSLKDLFNRQYRELHAVNDISLSVEQGACVGYIGPNGAGKSTTIKMLTGIMEPSSGQVQVNGFNPQRQRRHYVKTVGAVFGQRTQLWWDLAVSESLELLRQLYDVSKADFDSRLKKFNNVLGLEEFMATPVRKLSLGQRMKADLAAALLHYPRVLFLDEPTVGVDVITKGLLRDFLRYLVTEHGTTVLLTTHDMQDIEALCDRIVVIDHGQIIHDGQLDDFKHRYGGGKRIVFHLREEHQDDICATLEREGVHWQLENPRELRALVDTRQVKSAKILQETMDQFDILDVSIEDPSIEHIVKQLYGDREV